MSNQKMVSATSDRVAELSNSIKRGLETGQHYVELLDQMVNTDRADELLSATQQLVHLDLSDPFVQYPQHYQPADYFLLMMDRLLSLHDVDGLTVIEDDSSHHLKAMLDPLGRNESYIFRYDPEHNGAFFVDQQRNELLFFIDLKEHELRFSNRALVNSFIDQGMHQHNDLELAESVKPLVAFAKLMADELDFTIDLGILASGQDVTYQIAKPDLDLTVIDRLFVATAETDYMLMNLPKNNGAELRLEGIKLQISFDPKDYSRVWSFVVVDPEEQASFFDLLLHYPLIRQWYLQNRDLVAVRSLPLILQSAPEDSINDYADSSQAAKSDDEDNADNHSADSAESED
ncbi:hypothetical protein [Limosilactobacillus sp.]|uniref:hypothetical protein n=1 Tax=Limosilactobacillus sp. TaxID=2773925 RepID=UPI00345E6421